MKTIIKAILMFTILTNVTLASEEIQVNSQGKQIDYKFNHKDINSTIPRLDIKNWDPLYYQYRIVDNLPQQYDKKGKNYFFNPIYPVFFYKSYIRSYKKTKDKTYLKAIDSLTKALLVKAEQIKYKGMTAKIFNYEASGHVARMFHKHYSGLTNSYYVNIFSQLYELKKDIFYRDLAIEFANSMFIPIENGGVLYINKEENLFAFAEVPMEPHGWILNGWLSSIVSLHKANKILKNKRIEDLLDKNIDTLEVMLDKFDVPELCISRYNLTQFFWFRILKKDLDIKKITFIYPLDKNIELNASNKYFTKDVKAFSKWQPFILKKGNVRIENNSIVSSKILQFNGILSRSGYPEETKISIEFSNKTDANSFNFEIHIGEYSPLTSAAVNGKWKRLNKINFKQINEHTIEIVMPNYLLKNILGYPTNFMKKFTNGRRNAYHDIHIKWLIFLGQAYKRDAFLKTANKWKECKKKWVEIPVYKELFDKHNVLIDNNFLKNLDRYY